jgi:ABC-type transport system substrate-binding protein
LAGQALYHRAQEIIWDECPWIFTYEQPDICACSRKFNWTAGRRDEFWWFYDASLQA